MFSLFAIESLRISKPAVALGARLSGYAVRFGRWRWHAHARFGLGARRGMSSLPARVSSRFFSDGADLHVRRHPFDGRDAMTFAARPYIPVPSSVRVFRHTRKAAEKLY